MTSSCRSAASNAARLLMVSVRLLKALLGAKLILRQAAIPLDIVLRAADLCRGSGQLGLCLRDHRFLQPANGLEIRQCGLLPGDCGNRLRQRGAVVAIIQLHQQIAGVHRLIVGDRNVRNEPGHLWRDYRHVAADIGIVRALDEPSHGPPMVGVPRGTDTEQKGRPGQPKLFARDARVTRRRPCDNLALGDLSAHDVLPFAAGPGTERNAGSTITLPVRLSTSTGSAGSPVSVSMTMTLGPSGAKWRLPQASSDHSTGRKSRPRSVRTYSWRGGCSL